MANLKNLFPEFYQTNLVESDLSNSTDNLIVLDTNYLLDIIQLPTTVSKKYIEALEKVKDNIYIPYLVALEFNFKKSSIKKDKIKKINKYKNTLKQTISTIKNNIQDIDLVDKGEKEEFTKEILEITEGYSNQLNELVENKIESIITKEEVELYEKLIQIIEEKIGDKYEQAWITSVEEDGKARYEKKIPPGFDDITKDGEDEKNRRYGDIEYQRKFGDLLIWKDIIEYSKKGNKSGKKVIFVTNDGKSNIKSDLLYKTSNLTVGPNIHLMNELQTESNKEFHILENLRFVQLVNDLTDAEINRLQTSSEKLYRVKIPYDQIEEELRRLEEFNSKNEEYNLGIDREGYLIKKEKGNRTEKYEIENKARWALLEQVRDYFKQEQDNEDLANLVKKKFLKSNDYEDLNNQIDFWNKSNYKDEIMSDDDLRKKLSNFYKNYNVNEEDIDDIE